ncbi:hypothetical protein BJX99DRAFT_113016 [Aspergillus californicus]
MLVRSNLNLEQKHQKRQNVQNMQRGRDKSRAEQQVKETENQPLQKQKNRKQNGWLYRSNIMEHLGKQTRG